MGKIIVTDTNLTNIANAIRAKNGTQNTYTPSQMANAILNLPSGGGGPYTFTLLSSKEQACSTTSTTATSLCTVTSATPIVLSGKPLYIKIRDKAGKRSGYFYGSDNFIMPYRTGGSSNSSVLMRVIYRAMTTGYMAAYVGTSTTGYGIYAYSYTTSNGDIAIYSRYSSSNSLTINGTYTIEVYSMESAVNPLQPYT